MPGHGALVHAEALICRCALPPAPTFASPASHTLSTLSPHGPRATTAAANSARWGLTRREGAVIWQVTQDSAVSWQLPSPPRLLVVPPWQLWPRCCNLAMPALSLALPVPCLSVNRCVLALMLALPCASLAHHDTRACLAPRPLCFHTARRSHLPARPCMPPRPPPPPPPLPTCCTLALALALVQPYFAVAVLCAEVRRCLHMCKRWRCSCSCSGGAGGILGLAAETAWRRRQPRQRPVEAAWRLPRRGSVSALPQHGAGTDACAGTGAGGVTSAAMATLVVRQWW